MYSKLLTSIPLLLTLLLTLLLPFAAAATPVTMTIAPWQTTDGNFGFSAIHGATSGRTVKGGLEFRTSGSIQYEFSAPTQFVQGTLVDSVLTLESTSLQLDGGSIFELRGSVLDFGVTEGGLIGSLGYRLVDGASGSVESGAFSFYKLDFTNGACDANGLCASTGAYRLWGNNWDAASGNQGIDNVIVDGVTTTRLRGIDIGGDIAVAPVPEPGAALLFGAGIMFAGGRLRRARPL